MIANQRAAPLGTFTEQNRTEQNRTEQNRTEQNSTEQHKASSLFQRLRPFCANADFTGLSAQSDRDPAPRTEQSLCQAFVQRVAPFLKRRDVCRQTMKTDGLAVASAEMTTGTIVALRPNVGIVAMLSNLQ